jgi:anionic cell wall polymer biosynthesis LytR-Cps2A-Psr (LCP) family protein
MTLLLIGSDTRSTGYTWGLADVIRIVRIDFSTPRLTVLDFPRDLWVEIPEISDNLNGQDHEKLNQAYLYGNPGDGFGYWDHPSAGPGLLARTLDLNFGAKADHYLAVNMQTFVRMVDAVDGIDVTLEQRIGGSKNPHLQAGNHHLNGAEALAVARDRSEGVFSRGDNQNLVLCALQRKLVSPSVLPKIPELVRSFQGSVQTDLDPNTLGQLACLAGQMPVGNIELYSFPEELFVGTRPYDPVFEKTVFAWDFDPLLMRHYVAQFQAGSWSTDGVDSALSGTSSFCQ